MLIRAVYFRAAWVVIALWGGSGIAQETPRDLARLVDQFVARQWPDGWQPKLVNESEYVRRVTLDLAGRIPTSAEVERFRRSESLHKRAELVQRLINSPDFAFHHRNELDTLLLRRLEHNDAWRAYLLEATQENRPWDQLFREILAPEQACPDDSRPAAYLAKRIQDVDTMANDTSIFWFGVNVACAKCHDHPLVFDWTQGHYYGLASFFKRTFRTRAGFLGERFDGDIRYETTGGEQHQAEFMYLTGTKVDEPELDLDEETLKEYREAIRQAERDDKAELPPRPEFSPRARLVELALTDTQQQFFANNIVNRIWARMFGRGLVHPLDQMHSENPPSHPKLLERLSADLVEHGYDLKRLIHALALSDAYALRMLPADAANSVEPDRFAAAVPRPLSPHQLSLSLRIATANPQDLRGVGLEENWGQRREELERSSEGVAQRLEIPDDDFQVPVTESLWFSNNPQVENDYLGLGQNRLVGYLQELDADDEVVRLATRAVLSRDPNEDELAALTNYLSERSERRPQAIQHVVWALLGSPEFRFNH